MKANRAKQQELPVDNSPLRRKMNALVRIHQYPFSISTTCNGDQGIETLINRLMKQLLLQTFSISYRQRCPNPIEMIEGASVVLETQQFRHSQRKVMTRHPLCCSGSFAFFVGTTG